MIKPTDMTKQDVDALLPRSPHGEKRAELIEFWKSGVLVGEITLDKGADVARAAATYRSVANALPHPLIITKRGSRLFVVRGDSK